MSEIAARASEAETAIEALAWAALHAGEEPVSEGIYKTIRDLVACTRNLVEVTARLNQGLEIRAELGRLDLDHHGQDRWPTPGAAIAGARIAMTEATRAAQELATTLDEAFQVVSTIADSGNHPQGTCRCGHAHVDHAGPRFDGYCTIGWFDPEAGEIVDCPCALYRSAE